MSKGLVWLRRDLRLWDNHALSKAIENHDEVYCVFIFDKNILDKLPQDDHRVHFLHETLKTMTDEVELFHGDPVELIPKIAKKYKVDAVYTNKDYEQYALRRDSKVSESLFKEGVNFEKLKDQVLFEKEEVLNGSGEFYKVFTPYKNRYLEILSKNLELIKPFKVNKKKIAKVNKQGIKSLKDIGFKEGSIPLPDLNVTKQVKDFLKIIDDYDEDRDFPALNKTSGLSVYIRFGLVSIRSLLVKAMEKKSKGRSIWVSELIWRDFYSMLLQAVPKIEKTVFNDKYEGLEWDKDKKLLKAWQEGKTGFPLVDAGMRQLNTEGHMHNRVRMVVASFLTKTMLLDWREGEKYFAKKLFDYDLASNNGGWQWASSTGCDAAPYFRVFNPYRQSERFDKEGEYIKKYVPELTELPKKLIHDPSQMKPEEEDKYAVTLDKDYPRATVNYKKNREIIIKRFKDHGK